MASSPQITFVSLQDSILASPVTVGRTAGRETDLQGMAGIREAVQA